MNLATWSRANESYTDGEQVNFLAVKYSSRITTKSGDTVTTPQIIFSSGDALRKGNIIKYENTYWQIYDVQRTGYYAKVAAVELPDQMT